eukprot:sb/3479136/
MWKIDDPYRTSKNYCSVLGIHFPGTKPGLLLSSLRWGDWSVPKLRRVILRVNELSIMAIGWTTSLTFLFNFFPARVDARRASTRMIVLARVLKRS